MTDPLTSLTEAGVSIWLDDLSRDRLTSGSLADLLANDHVVGVTTNPTIFARAIPVAAPTTLRCAAWPPAASRSARPCAH
jgi:transaldolase